MILPNAAGQHPYFALESGREVFRLHRDVLDGDQFNPGYGTSRFAPFQDLEGKIVPSLYSATTFDGAAYETLFRERPAKYQTFPRNRLDDYAASRLTTRRELQLVRLFTPELAAWGIAEADLLTYDESNYPTCRELAALIWKDNPAADGMIWSSVRDSSALAMMLFEDRVKPGALTVTETRYVQRDADLLDQLRTTARRAGITISR